MASTIDSFYIFAVLPCLFAIFLDQEKSAWFYFIAGALYIGVSGAAGMAEHDREALRLAVETSKIASPKRLAAAERLFPVLFELLTQYVWM